MYFIANLKGVEYIIGSYEDAEADQEKIDAAFVNEIDNEIGAMSSESGGKSEPMNSNRYLGLWETPPIAGSADVISNNATHRCVTTRMYYLLCLLLHAGLTFGPT